MIVTVCDISRLFDNDDLFESLLSIVSDDRKEKVDNLKQRSDKCRSLAAGALLNATVAMVESKEFGGATESVADEPEVVNVCLDKFLELCASKYNYEVITGDRGKPYFKDKKLYFSLSHAGNYVICAVAETEVGADIEGNRKINKNISQRYFTENEIKLLDNCSEATYSETFFKIWTFKEAYGKYTGKGVYAELSSVDYTAVESLGMKVVEFEVKDYRVCVVCAV